MKLLYIILLLSFNLLASHSITAAEKPRILLESISNHAIRIGNGDAKDVYIFVDPMCKFSKALMKKINENKMLQLTNTYYIFLYRLPRLDSDKLIQYIYQSDEQKSTLLDVMVDEELIDFDDFTASDNTLRAIKKIAEVAKKLDMTVRPYMISFEKDSKYCKVSEGTASCLEELAEFDD